MNITNLKLAVDLCGKAGITAFIWGHRGLGKSSAVSQLADALGWGFIDMRLSQSEASDLRGLPDKMNNRTTYLPPADLPHGEFRCLECDHTWGKEGSHSAGTPIPDVCPNCSAANRIEGDKPVQMIDLHRGWLFLDELNRADDDVLQAAFQLVLDRKIGLYSMPSGWNVVCAGNYAGGADYCVNSFNDAAFMDRFCHFEVTVGQQYHADWSDYMTQHFGEDNSADKILQFVGFADEHLLGKMKSSADKGFSVQPSPRSWEMVAKVHQVVQETDYPTDVIRETYAGLIGMELARMFERFNTEVTPRDIIEKGLDAMKPKLGKLKRPHVAGLTWGLVSNAKGKSSNKKLVENVLDYMEWIATHKDSDRDLAVMMGKRLMEEEAATLSGAMMSNPNLARLAKNYQKKKGQKNTWIFAINQRPNLQSIMSKTSFGM